MNINVILKFKVEISALLSPEKQSKMAVAVSGGSDSLALSILLSKFLQEYGSELICITIDHGLRKNSSIEAIKTGKILKQYDIKHKIIPWCGKKPKSILQ